MSKQRGRDVGLGIVIGVVAVVLLLAGPGLLARAGAGGGVLTPSLASGTHCTVGKNPRSGAYDPVDHEVYVANSASANISILKGCTKVATVTLPNPSAVPVNAAFDPQNDRVYVTDDFLNQVYVIAGTSLVKTITSPTFNTPNGIVYDPGDGVLAIANVGANDVSFITSSGGLLGTNSVGIEPYQIAYDPYFARMFVGDWGSNNVTSIDAIYPTIQSSNINIPVGQEPVCIAFDFADNEDYVANQVSNNVTVFYGNGVKAGSVGVGTDPQGLAWDQSTLSLFVTNQRSGNVSVIKGLSVVRTITGPSGFSPVGVFYDDALDQVYVTNYQLPGQVFVYS